MARLLVLSFKAVIIATDATAITATRRQGRYVAVQVNKISGLTLLFARLFEL
jgi:hypothetical protein